MGGALQSPHRPFFAPKARIGNNRRNEVPQANAEHIYVVPFPGSVFARILRLVA
jgi:hypothetical protein